MTTAQSWISASSAGQALHVVVRGRPGAGHVAVVATVAASLGQRPCVRTPRDLRHTADPLEPQLSGRVAVWDARGFDVSPEDRLLAGGFLHRSVGPCISLVGPGDDVPELEDRTAFVLAIDPRDHQERIALWRAALATRPGAGVVDAVADHMAHQTRAGAALVARVVDAVDVPADATLQAWATALRSRLDDAIQPSQTRGVVVERPTGSLARLVVPELTRRGLDALRVLARHATDLATPDRMGVKALLSGPSGTGKTFAARALAAELGRPLYRVDLASVTSKWIGETEKHLQRALASAEVAGAVLLFDEGDALLGRRGDIERGADRYANLEVSYLLQAIEAFDGVLVVTTNLRANVDPAFSRRFDVCLDFPRPDAALRLALWRQELADDRSPALDPLLDAIAGVDLTGGHIAVACRLARAFALAAGRPLSPADLAHALVTELHKLGNHVAAARWQTRLQPTLPALEPAHPPEPAR